MIKQLVHKLMLILMPIPAIVLSTFFAKQKGLMYQAFAMNVLGMIVGILLFVCLLKWSSFFHKHATRIAWSVCALISLSFVFPSQEGVHRWISLGPVNLNISTALMPFVLFGLDRADDRRGLQKVLLILSMMLIFFFQPDAGQATAFAAASLPILLIGRKVSIASRIAGILIVLIGGVLTWQRLDPLMPVVHVEEILNLMIDSGVIGMIAIAAAVLPLFLPLWSQSNVQAEF